MESSGKVKVPIVKRLESLIEKSASDDGLGIGFWTLYLVLAALVEKESDWQRVLNAKSAIEIKDILQQVFGSDSLDVIILCYEKG